MSRIGNIIKVPDLRNKVLFTLAMLVLYRFGSYLPVPGIDQNAIRAIEDEARQGGVLGYLQLFSGTALTQFSLFALGIMPYITSSIIMQILTVVIPKLQEWQQQGAVGQRKITQWTRYLTVGIAVLQATGFTFLFANGGGGLSGNNSINLVTTWSPQRVMLIVISLTAGTALLMWMGELITNRGIGNGMSLIIMASVVSAMPAAFSAVYGAENGTVKMAIFLGFFVLMLGFIVFIEQGQRRIPVQFAKRVVGRKQ